jgi:hypothetical protein
VNTGRGDNVIGGAYIAISFSHHEQTEHVPAPDELDGSDPQPPNEDLPGSFYIADYIEKVDDQEVGSGLVIHGASSPPNCEAVARNLDNIKAEITGYNPYIEDENIRRHPRLFLQDQNSFHVGGVKDGKICGIPITFQLTKSIIDGGYGEFNPVRHWMTSSSE